MQRQVGPAGASLYAQLSILLAFAFVVMTVLAFWMAHKADVLTEEARQAVLSNYLNGRDDGFHACAAARDTRWYVRNWIERNGL